MTCFGRHVVCLLTLVLLGCAASEVVDTGPVEGGFTLRLRYQSGQNQFALYEIREDGRIAFGGGMDAVNDRFSWTGPLQDPDRLAILAWLSEQSCYADPPESTGTPPDVRYDVSVDCGGGDVRFRVRGEHPRLRGLRGLLEEATAGRHDAVLRRLPQAGPSSEVERIPDTRP